MKNIKLNCYIKEVKQRNIFIDIIIFISILLLVLFCLGYLSTNANEEVNSISIIFQTALLYAYVIGWFKLLITHFVKKYINYKRKYTNYLILRKKVCCNKTSRKCILIKKKIIYKNNTVKKYYIRKTSKLEKLLSFSRNLIMSLFIYILSIDYKLTDIQKNTNDFKDNKEYRKSIINVNNITNLLITIIVLILYLFVFLNNYNIYLIILFAYRFLSRSIEIIISFFKDICENKKKSSLENKDRILLAITSLIEISILYFISIYKDELSIRNIIHYIPKVLNPDLSCNVQIGDIFFYLLYTITSFVLISLTIVQYIANSNEKKV